ARITENLESNQAFLLSMLESGAEAEADIAAIEQRLKDSTTAEGRAAVASGGLREKLQRFEQDLHEIVGRNLDLRSQVETMRAALSVTEAEKERVAQARQLLGDQLQQVEDALTRVREEKRQLAVTVAELRGEIDSQHEQLAAAATIEADLKGEVSTLNGQLLAASGRQDGLQREIAGLQESLDTAMRHSEMLTGEREDLRLEVAELRQRMVDM